MDTLLVLRLHLYRFSVSRVSELVSTYTIFSIDLGPKLLQEKLMSLITLGSRFFVILAAPLSLKLFEVTSKTSRLLL